MVGRLEGPRGGREVRRACVPGHISVAGGLQRDSQATVVVTAPEIGRIEQARAGGIELRYKGVAAGACGIYSGVRGTMVGRLEGPRGGREVRRVRAAGHISVAGLVDRDSVALVVAA